MQVVLKVVSTIESDIICDGVESVEDAKKAFEPKDIQAAIEVERNNIIKDAFEVVDCDACDGWGVIGLVKRGTDSKTCKKCEGRGWMAKYGGN
jgi:DnaJ-class molecular chaperone